MAIGPVRITFPDGTTSVHTLLEQPDAEPFLVALGVEEGKWVVVEARPSDDPEFVYDVRVVERAPV